MKYTKRDRTEISAEILRAAKNGILKTHLVYKCNLNFDVIKVYLNRLIGGGLLQHDGRHYYTTNVGTDFISHADALRF